jgi:hypothetical protein
VIGDTCRQQQPRKKAIRIASHETMHAQLLPPRSCTIVTRGFDCLSLSTQVLVQYSSLCVNATVGTAPHQATSRCVKCERSVSISQREPLLRLRRVKSPKSWALRCLSKHKASIH